jgi:hypothetical protein
VLILIHPFLATCQGLNIKSGAILINRGNIVLRGNWINDGSFYDTCGTIIFAGTAQTINGTVPSAFNNLTITGSSTTTINVTGQTVSRILLCDGTLNAAGYITLLSTADQTALIDGSGTGQVTGNVTMQRYFPTGFGYKYISSPFQFATVGELSDDMDLGTTFSMFYRYDESKTLSGWVSYNTTADTLNLLSGYAANLGSSAVPNTIDMTGEVNNGSVSLTIYNNNNTYTQGFNLVGNPYPSPIDWDAVSGWTKTNIDDALYYFKASTTDQYGGTYSTYINGISSDSLATNIIPSMQGLFVHVTDGAYPVSGTLSLDNNVRITNLTHPFLKSGNTKIAPMIRLRAGFSGITASKDHLAIYFDEKADTIFESSMDALKLMNTDINVPNLYAVGGDGTKLSIDALPPAFLKGDIIPLGLKLNRSGKVLFSISSIENLDAPTEIYLTDNVTGQSREMISKNNYTVSLEAGEYVDRFFLSVISPRNKIDDDMPDESLFRTYSYGGILLVEINIKDMNHGTLFVNNLTGQVVYIKTLSAPGFYKFNPGLSEGIYMVTLQTEGKIYSRKVFIYY